MLYKKIDTLSKDLVNSLNELASQLKYRFSEGSRMRKGRNAPFKLSKYHYSKWFDWSKEQRDVVRNALPESIMSKALQTWFVKYDPVTGMLDEMDFGVERANPVTFVIVSLKPKQTIILDGNSITCSEGEVIAFSIASVHEIKPSEEGQLWLCVMIPTKLEDIK